MKFTSSVVLFLILSLFIEPSFGIGGWNVVTEPESNQMLVAAVTSALNQTQLVPRRKPGTVGGPLFTWSIVTAKSKVVSGMSWDVTVLARKTSAPFNCTTLEFQIWQQPWLQSVRIMKQNVKDLKCPSKNTPTKSPTLRPKDQTFQHDAGQGTSTSPEKAPPKNNDKDNNQQALFLPPNVPNPPMLPPQKPVLSPTFAPSSGVQDEPVGPHGIPIGAPPNPFGPSTGWSTVFSASKNGIVKDCLNQVIINSGLTNYNLTATSAKFKMGNAMRTYDIIAVMQQTVSPFACTINEFVVNYSTDDGMYTVVQSHRMQDCPTAGSPPTALPTPAISTLTNPPTSAPLYTFIEFTSYGTPNKCTGKMNGVITGVAAGACVQNLASFTSNRFGCSPATSTSPPRAYGSTYPWDTSATNIQDQHRMCDGIAPMFVMSIPLGCKHVSSPTTPSQFTSSNCLSSASPFSKYGPGLLMTRSRTLESCSLLADFWTFTPTNTCISKASLNATSSLPMFGGLVNSLAAVKSGMGSYKLTSCSSDGIAISHYKSTDCSGKPASQATSPLQGCTQNPADLLYRGMQCIR